MSLRQLHDTLLTTRPNRRATAHHLGFTRRRRYGRYGVDRNTAPVKRRPANNGRRGRNVELHLPIRREQTPFQHSQNLDMGIVDKACQCQAQQGRVQHCNTTASHRKQGLGTSDRGSLSAIRRSPPSTPPTQSYEARMAPGHPLPSNKQPCGWYSQARLGSINSCL